MSIITWILSLFSLPKRREKIPKDFREAMKDPNAIFYTVDIDDPTLLPIDE